MKKYLLYISVLLFLLLPQIAIGADFYIAQSAAGDEGGSSCANAHAVAGLTWAGGDIDDGDTLHLCGTITSTLTIGDSGGSGTEYTVKFEDDAKFSKAYWGTTSSAAIYATGKDYIIIDGGTNGIIENTANGTGLANQQDGQGIYITGSDNWEIENLTIKNLYVRTADSDDSNQLCRGIGMVGSSNISVHDNTIQHAYYCIKASTGSAETDDLDIDSNDISACSTGIVVALEGAYSYTNVVIQDNDIYDGYFWDGSWNGGATWNHSDGIHTWGDYAADTLEIEIYNNNIYGDWGAHTTAWIYLTDYTTPALLYNNVLTSTEELGQAFIVFHTSGGASVFTAYNNTIVGKNRVDNSGGVGIQTSGTNTATLKNNVFYNLYIGIYDSDEATTFVNDNNSFWCDQTGRIGAGWSETLTDWQTTLGGSNEDSSIDSDPSLDANYKPNNTNDPVVDAGADLSGTFVVDKDGTTRPTNGGNSNSFDIGAYEYDPNATPEPTGNHEVSGATSLSGVTIQ